ncbi:uracil-DNA glycosylase [Sulfitobacter sp. KE29]|uniref:uracil-DNA glycosylase n=1 Tax=Sulfitobacter TaxID=60136 RepID=UPI0007C31728|nr:MULTISPECIES: uracil-DNA glycosylase [Sulfitobacter]KZY51331.1 uracil-DNA glycosylase [Sulfitobacter sp. HI0054]MBO9438239.1 uracil-DNA glycosylase [Sulfitobacter sp. R18_2]MDF3418448.1 uracil-DNA glycosylase [Sulfitobacter sp. Ks38]MDF3425931.1 uracil-DNA glycosylase [Sulfitobacter sp. KE29]MDF3429511.1 uracil-DNA glycosylase [Sulfitobacter sp. S46]
MESFDYHQAAEMLAWQVELGATEAICDAPVNRYEVPASAPKASAKATKGPQPLQAAETPDPVALARRAAQSAQTLEELRAAIQGFEHCELHKGARNLVFADGVPGAPLMILGESPDRDEDRAGKPFAGRAGQMLDRMLAAIDMGRDRNVYLSNILPWRTPQGRDPKPDEIAMMRPFVQRHIELAKPKVLVLFGNWSCQSLLEKRSIMRLRGNWTKAADLSCMPMVHPGYLLRNPEAKREAWADLLSVQAKLRDG